MRVVAGTAGGRRLRSPEGETTRPTPDRVREAVFNMLVSQGVVEGARAADLFAGSGALGIEAISRGADHVWFVESDRHALDVIEDNLATLGFADRATVVRGDVDSTVPGSLGDGLDLVVADPPYAFDGWSELLARLQIRLTRDAVVVAESGASIELGPGWEKMRERTYGGTVITFASPPATSGVDA
ncbi:MAG: 16S rRNA (guanine(966)-N(2))-methyltransferase RsmD [Acidimicrobiales bacterium]|nr:16S rRNA (guanine(966)-N(2))-methyltransferase RsmD [Acidimicrobiales bacterium]